ncbi:MAG: ABC transporter substrate-binding protein [Burkholderiales bacterium]|nr:ABC transporter substrate-binding protein [Burkholderiales bacterium]
MTQETTRRQFVRLMTGIMGAGAAMTAGFVPFRAFGQAKDTIGVGWLRLACTGQSFVSEGAGHGAWQELLVRHQMFNAGAETIEALSAGVLDSSYLGVTPAIGAISRGVPAKIFVGGHKRGMGLVTRADSGIKSLRDLRGKNISTLGRGSLPDMQIRVSAKEAGLDPDRDFNLITLPSADAVTALAKGSIDGLMNCPEWPQVALTSIKGSRFVATDMDGTLWHGPNTQCVVVIVKEGFAKQNPRILKKLLHVHVKATRTMIDDPDGSAKIIAKFEGAPPDATKLALSHMNVTPVPSIDSLVKWRDKMFEFGFTKRKAKLAELVELGPLREVLVEAGEKQWLADLDKEIALLAEIARREA